MRVSQTSVVFEECGHWKVHIQNENQLTLSLIDSKCLFQKNLFLVYLVFFASFSSNDKWLDKYHSLCKKQLRSNRSSRVSVEVIQIVVDSFLSLVKVQEKLHESYYLYTMQFVGRVRSITKDIIIMAQKSKRN